MRWDLVRKRLVYPLVVLVFFIGLMELGLRAAYAVRNSMVDEVPLPYVIGHGYAAYPPWSDRMRILVHDEDLLWRLKPSVERLYIDVFSPVHDEQDRIRLARRFLPSVPDWLDGNPTWKIETNSSGYRDDEFPGPKQRDEFRVACFGDSWTFGMNVGQQQTYPQQLEARLRNARPGRPVEVFNMGVLGYTTYQGRQVLLDEGLPLEPDVVVLAFGQNDGQYRSWKDREGTELNRSLKHRAFRMVSGLEVAKMSYYLMQLARKDYQPIDKRIRFQAQRVGNARSGKIGEEILQSMRVPPDEYEQNLTDMIRAVRERGGDAVLLFNELEGEAGSSSFIEGHYRAALRRISERESVPFIDSGPIIAAAQREMEADLERGLGLVPDPPAPSEDTERVDVVFRVFMGEYEVPDAVYIAGTDPQLGDVAPNDVRMYDDGTHGDQRAGDGVWSLAASFEPGRDVFYVYTNSGDPGRWTGVDLPDTRHLHVTLDPATGPHYLPLDSFGTIYMQADSWHTNARGYGMIADRLAVAIESLPVAAGP